MTADPTREQLLEQYGRFYGDQHFAVAFTQAIVGDPEAKQCTTKGWQTTLPLAGGDFAAGLIGNRGKTRNPVIVLRPSNLIVLECDTEDDLVRVDELGLPETLTVRSSADYKRHFYFRPPADLESLPYVAFRFESGKLTADAGRYFLAPPSIHPSGQVYSFLPGRGPGTPIAELPLAVYRRLAEQARVEDSEQREQIRIDPSAKIRAGNRRDLIFRYACMLRRWGLSRSEISQLAHTFNETRCDPPVDAKLVDVQIDGAMKKQGDQELAHAAAHPLADAPPQPVATVDSWIPVDLNTLPDAPPIKPTLGGVGIVYPGKRHVFSGPPESAKTLAAYAIGIRTVREGGTIVLVDFEMGGYDARGRLRELGATPEDIRRIHYLEPDEPATQERVTRLVNLRPQLVIVDAAAGAYSLEGLDDNKRADVEKLARLYVTVFWRKGIATIFVDHVVKDSETRGKFAIGSERKLGGADVHLGFETLVPISRGTAGHYKIVTHKDRGGWLQRGKLADLHLVSHPETHEIQCEFKPAEHTPDDAPFRPTTLMERISGWLQMHREPASQKQVETGVKGHNAKAKRTALDVLVVEGFVTETAGPRNARLFEHVRVYKQDDPACNPQNSTTSSTSSDLVQPRLDEMKTTSSTSSPPYRGTDDGRDEVERSTSSSFEQPAASSWLDDLAATVDLEQAAGTLDEEEAA